MAAPVATTRQTPAGIKLADGYQSLITFANDPDISIWEKSITPPAVDGGDTIEQTTMHNSVWRTMKPRALATLADSTFTGAYDPDIYDEILAILNQEDTVTVTFPDGSTLAFFGYLRLFTPNELTEGEQPDAVVTITPTNIDPATQNEEGPVMTETVGT